MDQEMSMRASEYPGTNMVAVSQLRPLPIALHVYLFGAAIFGYGVGVGIHDPSMHSLIALAIGCALCIVGYWLFRPFMRLAKRGIAQIASDRVKPEEEEGNDAAH